MSFHPRNLTTTTATPHPYKGSALRKTNIALHARNIHFVWYMRRNKAFKSKHAVHIRISQKSPTRHSSSGSENTSFECFTLKRVWWWRRLAPKPSAVVAATLAQWTERAPHIRKTVNFLLEKFQLYDARRYDFRLCVCFFSAHLFTGCVG